MYDLEELDDQSNNICIDVLFFLSFNLKNKNQIFFLKIKLVGPYGTNTRNVFKSEHVILVACKYIHFKI